jgi:hypothetical protein
VRACVDSVAMTEEVILGGPSPQPSHVGAAEPAAAADALAGAAEPPVVSAHNVIQS